ncbi:MAG: ATP-binding protein [Lachnospiraceae bacterium]|nr:ATP-binding protein [Lachnospiraceae bacterium]
MHIRNDIIEHILAQYDEKRRNARYALDERRAQVYDKAPGVRELELKIARDSLDRAQRSLIANEPNALDGMAEDNQALETRIEKLLVENGFPSDYLKLRYECERCKDTGYIDGERCGCFKKALSKILLAESNMEHLLETENFETFDASIFSNDPADRDESLGKTPYENIVNLYEKAMRYVNEFDQKHGNILIYGPAGVGKTFISSCIAKALIDTSHAVLYHTAQSLFSALEAKRFGTGDRDVSRRNEEYIYNCDLLIIDDLGSEFYTQFTASSLFDVINARMLAGQSTIISTNLSFDRIVFNYSERTYSRICKHYDLFKIIGTDLRRQT